MEIYRIEKNTDEWLYKAYDYVRTDAFCFGQNIPVEIEFSGDDDYKNQEGIIIIDDHKPVAGCRLAYPEEGTGKIERVCVIREKQKDGYGRILIDAAEKWLKEKGINHVVITSQDRAEGFYNKLGYARNDKVDVHAYDKPHEHKEPKVPVNIPKLDLGFTCVLVEKEI